MNRLKLAIPCADLCEYGIVAAKLNSFYKIGRVTWYFIRNTDNDWILANQNFAEVTVRIKLETEDRFGKPAKKMHLQSKSLCSTFQKKKVLICFWRVVLSFSLVLFWLYYVTQGKPECLEISAAVDKFF